MKDLGMMIEKKNDEVFFVNCGSKTIKSYLADPRRPGVSLVKATQSKVIAVLGNLIRVYSFDIFNY